MSDQLAGLRVLLLEDEFLIAMDVEQLCRDHGAAEVVIMRSVEEMEAAGAPDVDVAIIDLMLNGVSTFGVASELRNRAVPFVFASGYTDLSELGLKFPGVAVVGKPYAGDDLVDAVVAAYRG